jgi:hypothetical protein
MEVTMNQTLKAHFLRPAAVMLALLLGLALVGVAIAQVIQANSDMQDPPVYVPGIAYGVSDETGQTLASPGVTYPDDNPPLSAALAPNAPAASFSYYFVSGATLVARSSSDSYSYDGLGCVHVGTGGLVLNTDLQIPVGSEIKYLRLYYYDNNNPGFVTGYISKYPPSQSSADIVAVSSPASASTVPGYVVSARITQTVDYEGNPYLLIGRPSVANSNLRICGLRVAYYAPVTGYTFMPIISKNNP